MLKLQPGGDPAYDADNPLDADLVLIDETSMVDVILAKFGLDPGATCRCCARCTAARLAPGT